MTKPKEAPVPAEEVVETPVELPPPPPKPLVIPKEQAAYTVIDFLDSAQMKRDLAFTTNNLTGAMMEQSSMFAHYGVLSAQASRQVDVIKMLLENVESAIYKIIRDDMADRGEKFTETLLERMISRNSRVIAMKKALNEAKRVESIGKIAVEAFRHRRDMLIQQGMLSREEMKGEVRIAEKNIREEAQSAQKSSVLDRMKERKENASSH